MLLELENLHAFIVTSLSLICIVKITSICLINSAVEIRFPKKITCWYFIYHANYHNPK